jgi:hypothetical protein
MPTASHCRHCYGDCDGKCLIPGAGGLCIHKSSAKLTVVQRLALLRTGGFWRRVFWGDR